VCVAVGGQPKRARTNEVLGGKYPHMLRQKVLQYPHIASPFFLAYDKYLLA
jgi:hypothetical protein